MRLLATHCYIQYLLRTSVACRPLASVDVLPGTHKKWLSSKSGSVQDKKIKSVQLTSRITPHDLQVKIKKASELVQKGHLTKIAIKNMNPMDTKTPANLFKEFTSAVQEFATVKQSQNSATELMFTLKPNDTSTEGTENESEENELKPAKLHQNKGSKSETAKT